jgi:hypothetical protein
MHFYFKIAIINYDRHALNSVGEISALFDCQRIVDLYKCKLIILRIQLSSNLAIAVKIYDSSELN